MRRRPIAAVGACAAARAPARTDAAPIRREPSARTMGPDVRAAFMVVVAEAN
jgi:hypothetical protein